jgi:hypothetical protein
MDDENKAKEITDLVQQVRLDYKKLNVDTKSGEVIGDDTGSYPTQAEKLYDEYIKLKATDPQAAVEMMIKLKRDIEHPNLYSQVKKVQEDKKLEVTKEEKRLRNLDVLPRAEAVAKQLKNFPKGSQQRAAAVARMKKVGIITDAVYKMLLKMQREGSF